MTDILWKTQIGSVQKSGEIVLQSSINMHSYLQNNKTNIKLVLNFWKALVIKGLLQSRTAQTLLTSLCCAELSNSSGNILIVDFYYFQNVLRCHGIEKSCCSAVQKAGAKELSPHPHSASSSRLLSQKVCTSGGNVLSWRIKTSCFNIKEQIIACMYVCIYIYTYTHVYVCMSVRVAVVPCS